MIKNCAVKRLGFPQMNKCLWSLDYHSDFSQNLTLIAGLGNEEPSFPLSKIIWSKSIKNQPQGTVVMIFLLNEAYC